jgi:hypothetical protein
MYSQLIKLLLVIFIIIYLFTSYVVGSLNPFDAPKFVRFIQVCIVAYIGYEFMFSQKNK